MTVLGIDTSTAFCGAALAADGKLVSSAAAGVPQAHAEKLLPLIDRCLRAAGPAGGRIDAAAVASGPGSFTGLRVGFSAAKGICYAKGCALVAVPTFTAWARAGAMEGWAPDGGLMVMLMAAGRDDVYSAVFRRAGSGAREERPPFVAAAGDLPAIVAAMSVDAVITDERERAAARLAGYPAGKIFGVADGGRNPADVVALIGEEMARAGAAADLRTAEPSYLKEFSFHHTGKGA